MRYPWKRLLWQYLLWCQLAVSLRFLEKRSINVKQYRNPHEGGSGPIRSKWTWSKRAFGIGSFSGIKRLYRVTFDRWQWRYTLAQTVISLVMLIQTNFCAICRLVALPLVCDKPCTISKIRRRKIAGTNGHCFENNHSRDCCLFRKAGTFVVWDWMRVIQILIAVLYLFLPVVVLTLPYQRWLAL